MVVFFLLLGDWTGIGKGSLGVVAGASTLAGVDLNITGCSGPSGRVGLCLFAG